MKMLGKVCSPLTFSLSALIFLLISITGCTSPVDERFNKLNTHLEELSLTVDGVERRYLVHLPPDEIVRDTAMLAVPVVVAFHGAGGTSKAMMVQSGLTEQANTSGFIAVFPQALPPDPSSPEDFKDNPPTWNDGSGRFASGSSNVDDITFIDLMLNQISERYPIDTTRIFATGFSNGASMTFRTGVELGHRFRAIAPVAGALWIDESRPLRLTTPISMLYITGTNDSFNPLSGGSPKTAGGRELNSIPKPSVQSNIDRWLEGISDAQQPVANSSWIQEDVLRMTYLTSVLNNFGNTIQVEYLTVEGQGHVWPGKTPLLPEWIVGKASTTFDATAYIWDFFERQSSATPQALN